MWKLPNFFSKLLQSKYLTTAYDIIHSPAIIQTPFLFSNLISSIIPRGALETLQKPHSSVYNHIHVNLPLILIGTKQPSACSVVLRCVWSVTLTFTIREFTGCRWLTTEKHAPYQGKVSSYIRINQKIELKDFVKRYGWISQVLNWKTTAAWKDCWKFLIISMFWRENK